jgi:FkbM family methyltransferase
MISRVTNYMRAALNGQLRDCGYALKWMPAVALRQSDRVIDVNFAMLAAHLMLSQPEPYFIGIGANDGITHDPLYPFVRDFGWRGIMVEPIPEAFMALEQNYARFDGVTLVNAAIGCFDGEGTIYSVEMSEPTAMTMSLHSSFNKDVLLRGKEWHPDLGNHVIERKVPIMSFATLLARANGHPVDVLKIDTEGYDLEILKTVDFSVFRPRLILAEQANLSRAGKIEMAQLLLAQGYRIAMTSLDMIGYKPLGLEDTNAAANSKATIASSMAV